MSCKPVRLRRLLIRTARRAPLLDPRNSIASGRAPSLSKGPTASSRSAQTTSAPAASALENISGFEAGTNSRLRHRLMLRAFAVLLELSGQLSVRCVHCQVRRACSEDNQAGFRQFGRTNALAQTKGRKESGARALQERPYSSLPGDREPADQCDPVGPVSGGFDTAHRA